MKMSSGEREELRQQAIKAEELRVDRILTFLETHPLDTEVNKAVALELMSSVSFIERTIERLEGGDSHRNS
jgi:hypothetical protein